MLVKKQNEILYIKEWTYPHQFNKWQIPTAFWHIYTKLSGPFCHLFNTQVFKNTSKLSAAYKKIQEINLEDEDREQTWKVPSMSWRSLPHADPTPHTRCISIRTQNIYNLNKELIHLHMSTIYREPEHTPLILILMIQQVYTKKNTTNTNEQTGQRPLSQFYDIKNLIHPL